MSGVGRDDSGLPYDLTGRQIAGYRVEAELGRGGMAVVYRAHDVRLGRTVALKVLAPEWARNDSFRARFTQESQAAAAIDHPHIVPVFEADEVEGLLFIAMRYVPGQDLRALLDRTGPLPLAAAIRIATQVASALDAAHDHDLVHRDVKPANILVAAGTDEDHPEHVYLADFGLTKKSLSLSGITTVGDIVGTVNYMAPEQIDGLALDGRCDQYSLGCVVHELLTGAPPFQRDNDFLVLMAHKTDLPPLVSAVRPDLPGGVDEVVGRALAKVPGDRFASCLQFTGALRLAARPDPAPPGPPSPGPAPLPPGAPAPREPASGPRPLPPPPSWALPVLGPRPH
ncbi:serine/threonine protein kinase [Streptomyces bambusae]|uniref:serine/threonine-protein kinase n=1 Tax=Streptomyces bambusae TaxID=1550616 RepID=UPI001CFC7924|nr:serine/threonine-protein kinase [Streptomyces bambusae]MCB5166734.1 serine/threonine protein kinase [Streptomyces bambusae]